MRKIKLWVALSFVSVILLMASGCACEHEYGAWNLKTAATCTEAGVEERACAKCKETEERAVEAKGHAYGSWNTTKTPTCTVVGTESSVCSGCGDKQNREVAKLAHTYGGWTTVQASTCAIAGKKEHACIACGAKEEATLELTAHKYGSWQTVQAATCTAEGKKERTCSGCGVREAGVAEKIAHKYGSWQTVQAATCTAEGKKERACTSCGVREAGVVEKLVHKYGSWQMEKQATCTESGSRYRKCSCGYSETETLNATGHSWKSATCTTAKTCSTCGQTSGSANGHKWAAATCTTPKTCASCGMTEGAALGHVESNGKCINCGLISNPEGKLIQYIVQNGTRAGNTYGVLWNADGFEYVIMYDVVEDSIAFCQTYKDNDGAETILILEYEYGASKQNVLCGYTYGSVEISSGGYIYTSTYNGSEGSIRSFVCNPSAYKSSMKGLAESGLEVMFLHVGKHLKTKGITLKELGFSSVSS